ncbi:succinate-semialdehyde dehydrogenase / glutarate-semialdehyde dehydrogenase [Frankineae bacterium MT45]|nr:succinate-semialdehyde dehydrogenase / glutarate-semialdehyde dehydrogenase [Frankineae bacterium MT45]
MTESLIVDPEKDPTATWCVSPSVARRLTSRIVATSGTTRTTTSPANGAPIAAVPVSSVEDVRTAFATAAAAQKLWAQRPAKERAAIIRRIGEIAVQRQEEGLDILQTETGKARAHAFDEIFDVAANAAWISRSGPSVLKEKRHFGVLQLGTPVREVYHAKGVIGMIAPWNYPLILTISDAMPAWMSGNAVVLKPDSQTPLIALWAAEIATAAGLPEGLFQIVYGSGTTLGPEIIKLSNHVSFTGSTATGRTVAEQAARDFKGVSLELGGKNPAYVAADANIERAAEGLIRDCFGNTGHSCVSIERIYVHHSVYDQFLKAFGARAAALRIGTRLDWSYDVGSISNQSQFDTISAHVADATAKGARVVAGGKARPEIGPLAFEPTVLADVPETADCYADETFGPLVSVYPVGSDEEAISRANDTIYGLNATVWSGSGRRGRELARQIESGTVTVNDAFTVVWSAISSPMGGRKQSGVGRRHGAVGITRYTEVQTIAIQAVPLKPLYDRGGAFYGKFITFAAKASQRTRFPWP